MHKLCHTWINKTPFLALYTVSNLKKYRSSLVWINFDASVPCIIILTGNLTFYRHVITHYCLLDWLSAPSKSLCIFFLCIILQNLLSEMEKKSEPDAGFTSFQKSCSSIFTHTHAPTHTPTPPLPHTPTHYPPVIASKQGQQSVGIRQPKTSSFWHTTMQPWTYNVTFHYITEDFILYPNRGHGLNNIFTSFPSGPSTVWNVSSVFCDIPRVCACLEAFYIQGESKRTGPSGNKILKIDVI